MTSEQVMLALAVAFLMLAGCTTSRSEAVLAAPYASPRVWAVVPLRNESGSLRVDGARIADHLARQLENAHGIDVLAVNRTIAAMQAMNLPAIDDPQQALQLMEALGCDGLVYGTVTDYDPYDPPKLGLAIELYSLPDFERIETLDTRALSTAATDGGTMQSPATQGQPVSVVSAYFDAASPRVVSLLQRYGRSRSPQSDGPREPFETDADDRSWRLYRISMDLYSEFVAHEMSRRLLESERRRVIALAQLEPVP